MIRRCGVAIADSVERFRSVSPSRRSGALRGGWALAIAIIAMACVDEGQPFQLSERDPAEFASWVQPVVGPGCGSLDCHGDPGRPLTLLARYGRRLSGEVRGLPLEPAELYDNALSAAAISGEWLLKKPLAEARGGMYHGGRDLWTDEGQPEYRCLASWIDEAIDEDACAEAALRAPY